MIGTKHRKNPAPFELTSDLVSILIELILPIDIFICEEKDVVDWSELKSKLLLLSKIFK